MARSKPFGSVYSTGTPSKPAFNIRWPGRPGGPKRPKESGFKSRGEAKARLAEIQTRRRAGLSDRPSDQQPGQPGKQVTLCTVAEDWLRLKSELTLRGHRGNRGFYNTHIAPFFEDDLVSEIGEKRLLEFRLHLTKKWAKRARPGKHHVKQHLRPTSVNLVLALLQRILTFAVKQKIIAVNPITELGKGGYLLRILPKEVEPPIAEKADVVRLLDKIRDLGSTQGGGRRLRKLLALAESPNVHEAAAARAAAAKLQADFQRSGNPVYPFLATLIYTGLRRGEACALKWSDINFDFKIIRVRGSYEGPTKSGKPRTIPLMKELEPILLAHRRNDPWKSDRVFTDPNTGQMYRPTSHHAQDRLNAALRALDMPHVRVHDLRHVYASHYLMGGGHLDVLQDHLGHSSPLMTRVYAHISKSFIAGESSRVSFRNASYATRSRPDGKVLSLVAGSDDSGEAE